MPVYHARGVATHLGAISLADTVTREVVLRKGERAKHQSVDAEQKLLSSKPLPESPVHFPGDNSHLGLNWLGNAPFMQVQVHKTPAARDHEDGQVHRSMPQALVLHLELSDKTFNSGLYQLKTHLKVEILFNGQLSSCMFVPIHDVRSGAKPLHQVFAGTRVDYLAERPWIILPSGTTAKEKACPYIYGPTPQCRWQQICEALKIEARQRGEDAHGSVPPTATYLLALATMQMPEQVSDMQKPGSQQFGIIDIIISAGNGRKITSGAPYLKAPQRLTDERFAIVSRHYDTTIELSETRQPTAKSNEEALMMSVEHSPEVLDVAVGSDCPTNDERSTKRRALTPRETTTHDAIDAPHQPAPLNLFSKAAGPYCRTPAQNVQELVFTSPIHDPLAVKTSVPKQDGNRSRTISTPGQEFTYIETGLIETPRDYKISSSDDCHGSYSQNDIHPIQTHTPWLRLPPSSPSLPALRSETVRKSNLAISSSLKRRSPSSPKSQYAQELYTPFRSSQFSTILRSREMLDAVSFAPPITKSWSSAQRLHEHLISTKDCICLSQDTISHEIPYRHKSQFDTAHMLPQTQSNILPYPHAFYGYRNATPSQAAPSAPYNHHLPAALPPTGLFTVPTKPKQSLSSMKTRPFAQVHELTMVKRLVITGHNGVVVVDHRWFTVQRLQRKAQYLNDMSSIARSPTKNLNWNNIVTTCEASRCVEKVPEHTAEANTPRTMAKIDDNPEPASTPALPTPPVSTNRLASGCNILEIQGSKVATFWPGKPEEMLPGAATLQRSESSIKHDITSAAPAEFHMTATSVGTLDAPESLVSSPLSSVPTTPESDFNLQKKEMLVQVDGSPECKTIHLFRSGLARPSSPKRLAATIRTSPLQVTSTPDPSSFPNNKKRKSQISRLSNQPRNFNQVQTTANPSLNRNSVIAFAESHEKHTQGVLRQVRGERQGIFKEEYVVFAARFFVPGD